MIRSTRHGRRALSLLVRTHTSHDTPSPVSPLHVSALACSSLHKHVYYHLQSYPSSVYSLSTSSKQSSRSAPPRRPTLLSPHPQSLPRLRLHLAHNKASIGRRQRRRQYGVAASLACYPLTYVFYPVATNSHAHALSSIIRCTRAN